MPTGLIDHMKIYIHACVHANQFIIDLVSIINIHLTTYLEQGLC